MAETAHNEFKFLKQKVTGYVGYELVCFKSFELNGEKLDAVVTKQLFEADFNKEIPENEKQEVMEIIDKHIAQQFKLEKAKLSKKYGCNRSST